MVEDNVSVGKANPRLTRKKSWSAVNAELQVARETINDLSQTELKLMDTSAELKVAQDHLAELAQAGVPDVEALDELLQATVADSNVAIDRLSAEAQKYRDKCGDVQEELETTKEYKAALEDELAKARGEVDLLQLTKRNLEEQVDVLENSSANRRSSTPVSVTQLEALRGKARIAELEAREDTLAAEIAQLKAETVELVDTAARAAAANDTTGADVIALREEHQQALEAAVATHVQKIEALKVQHQTRLAEVMTVKDLEAKLEAAQDRHSKDMDRNSNRNSRDLDVASPDLEVQKENEILTARVAELEMKLASGSGAGNVDNVDNPEKEGVSVLVFPDLDYDATDFVKLKENLRRTFLAHNIENYANIPITFTRGSVIATVTTKNAADAETITHNAADIVSASSPKASDPDQVGSTQGDDGQMVPVSVVDYLKKEHAAALEDQQAAHEAELDDREADLMADFQEQSLRMVADMAATKEDIATKDETIALVRQECFSLKADVAGRDGTIESAIQEVDDLRAEVATRDETIESAIKEVASLTADIAAGKQQEAALQAAVAEHGKAIASATRREEPLKADIAQRDAAIESANEDIRLLTEDIAQRDVTVESASAQIKSLTEDVASRDEDLSLHSEAIALLKEEIHVLNADVEAHERTIDSCKEDIRVLSSDVVSREEDIESITEELVQACAEIGELKAEVRDLEEEVGHRSFRRVADNAARHIYSAADEGHAIRSSKKVWRGTDPRNNCMYVAFSLFAGIISVEAACCTVHVVGDFFCFFKSSTMRL